MKSETNHKQIEKEREQRYWEFVIFMLVAIVFAFFHYIEWVVIFTGLSIGSLCKTIYWDLKDTILHPPKIKGEQ